jgi:predicted RNA-binding Zn-ribbon protein involved in translation (DUF1610 family)
VLEERVHAHAAPYEARLRAAEASRPVLNAGPLLVRRQAVAVAAEARSGLEGVFVAVQMVQDATLSVLREDPDDASMLLRLRKLVPEAPAAMLGLASEARVRHALFEFDRCAGCGSALHMETTEHSLLCPACGVRIECPDPGSMAMSVTYYNLDRRPSLLGHRRLPKLKEFLKQLLAKQKSVVPMAVLLDVTAHLVTVMGLKNQATLTFAAVRQALVALGMRNFVDYCTQIYCRIKGCAPPSISPEDEEALFVLFAAIQEPFEDLKERQSSTFFSMSFVVLALCKFLGLRSLLPFIPLTNPRTRVDTQQRLLRKIFERLQWAPFPELVKSEISL